MLVRRGKRVQDVQNVEGDGSDNLGPCGTMSSALMPATETGFFIASWRKGSPSSWLIIASINVVLPFSI